MNNERESLNENFVTNPASKFRCWTIKLENGANLTGISYIPQPLSTNESSRPLIVGIHGGTCTAHNYDVSPSYTASTYCDLLGVPFVAFNRPNYVDSSGWVVDSASVTPKEPQFKAADGLSFFEEEARWYHELIFPALWKEFAVPIGCTSLVTTSHSMAVLPTVIAGSLYSRSKSGLAVGYYWGGMVLSGLAVTWNEEFMDVNGRLATNEYSPSQLPPGWDSNVHTPPYYSKDKVKLMLGSKGMCDSDLGSLVWKQTTPLFIGEVTDLVGMWLEKKAAYKADVRIPVLYGLGEHDWIWKSDKEDMDTICAEFTNSPRVEGAVVKNAPHAIELSKVSRGWWIRVFGWAIEVAGSSASS